MASGAIHKLTEEQYLALEETAPLKSGFYARVMYAMSGGTVEQYTRQPDGTWRLRDNTRSEDQLAIESIGVLIPKGDIYERARFNKRAALRDALVEPE